MKKKSPYLVYFISIVSTITTVTAQQANHLVISEIRYDERSGVNEEFVEIYNPTNSPVSLEEWDLVYKSKTGTSWRTKVTFSSGHQIQACGFFLWGGSAVVPIPDSVETSQSRIGLGNSGGHIALRNPNHEIIDKVAWEGGDSPEGSGDAGKTGDGGSLERKASASSTSASMAKDGDEETIGNSYDTDDNANDFVIHDSSGVNPQNSESPSEPPLCTCGAGSSSILPEKVFGSDTIDVRITVFGDSGKVIDRLGIVLPEEWEWSGQSDDVSLPGQCFANGETTVSEDTILISNCTITDVDSGIAVIKSISSPDSAEISIFTVLTAVIGDELKPICKSPRIHVKAPIVPIIRLHQNDSQGLLIPPFEEGKEVTVSGIITVGTGTFSSSRTDIYIQDKTAGINIFSSETPISFTISDSVTVTGTLDQYNGMTEIIPDWNEITIHSIGHNIPDTLLMTCNEVNQTFQPDSTEFNEGRLIRLNKVMCGSDPSVISDATGSATLYINENTQIPEPFGTFDIVGILKQYKSGGPPYTSGYEIVPRFPTDIIQIDGPHIISIPAVKAWNQDGVTIHWQTDVPATSIVHFGKTPSYNDSIICNTPLTEHRIDLNGLHPGTIYHYRIVSENQKGSNFTGDNLFITLSHPSSTGEINVYFNGSVEKKICTEDSSLGEQNLAHRLVRRINQAKYSIDACYYSMTDTLVQNALVRAYKNGVKIRFINDSEHDLFQIASIQAAGIPIIQNNFGDNEPTGIMHNKFAVFDHRDTSSFCDDWVWTGSYNPNFIPKYPPAVENAIEIQDQSLAEIYTTEFEEMWGSEEDIPDPDNSRFGNRKKDNTPHTIEVNRIPIHIYMSPSDRTTRRIIDAIESADSSLYFCIFSFTRTDIADAMLDKCKENTGFRLRGVFDASQKESTGSFCQWTTLSGSPSADVRLDKESGLLHHKYMIIDGDYPEGDPVLITGSHNWSTNAETVNDENTLIIHDKQIANQYCQEFAARYHNAGGTDTICTKIKNDLKEQVPRKISLFQNYPNPFNNSTIIQYSVPKKTKIRLSVYDLRSRFIIDLWNGFHAPGSYKLVWKGTDRFGQNLPSGIFLVRLESDNVRKTKKVVIVR